MRALAAIALLGAPAWAGGTGDAALDALLAVEGDVGYGAYLAGECTGCHASLDQATELPSLNTLPDDYIREQMHAYRTGAREHPVMNMIAARLSDEEIAALGAYLSTVED